MVKAKEYIKSLLEYADVRVNGNRSWDIQIHNEDFYKRVLSEGPLGLGESYMGGWWDSEKLDEFFYKVLISKLDKKIKPDLGTIILNLKSKFLNMQVVMSKNGVPGGYESIR